MLLSRIESRLALLACSFMAWTSPPAHAQGEFEVTDSPDQIKITSSTLEAGIRKKSYVTGVYGGTFVDKKTGFHDAGFGLDIVDWIMEPGSDEDYRDQLAGDLPYKFGNAYHGNTPKRSIEGPQICTRAGELSPVVVKGPDFVAVKSKFQYYLAAPGKKAGSQWHQTIVFPAGKRYFISSDRIDAVNSSEAMFLRLDMPGHIKHNHGDTFSEVYLSYYGKIKPIEFFEDFAPDTKFIYRRPSPSAPSAQVPKRFIRAYHMRDPKTGAAGPWLAGMTLDPNVVSEAWCHQRSYVCFIEEFGGRPIRAGQAFSAAFIVGYFDSIEEMEKVYDQYAGNAALEADEKTWRLLKETPGKP